MEQYCIYLRKSRKDDEAEQRNEGDTLLMHEKTLIELAKRQRLNVTQVHREIVSGDTIAARPVMQQLLKEVEQGMWTGVLVMEVERLTRGDATDQGQVAKVFKYSDTLIVTPSKTFDPNNEYDEEYFEFGLFMSRRELKTITRRLQRGRQASVKEGRYIGSRDPYGYARIKVKEKGWTLEFKPEEADIVRMIFDLYVNGEEQADGSKTRLGTGVIARRLNTMKIPPQRGDMWVANTLRDLLSNPIYIGMIRWNYRPTTKKMVDGKVELSNPRAKDGDFTLVKGLHDPIIDTVTFEKAQEIMKKGQRPANDKSIVKNPLASILICGLCGRTMARRASTPSKKYQYPDSLYCYLPECENVGAYLDIVEGRILEALEQWLAEYTLKWNDGSDKKKGSVQADVKQKALKKLESELAELNKQRDGLHDFLERGIYDIDTFLGRSQKIGERIRQTKEDCAVLLADMQADKEQDTARTLIIPKIENVLDVYRTLPDAQAKNDLLKEVLDKVVYVKRKSTRWGSDSDDYELTLYPKLPVKSAL